MSTQLPSPWYKQKWPWFVISFPLLTVLAGIITYKIAADNPHSLVQDDYFKEGLAINQSLAKQEQAITQGIRAILTMDRESQLILVNLSSIQAASTQPLAEELKLTFSHPTQQKKDRIVILSRLSNNEFAAQLPELPKAYWHVRLMDKSERWLIKSRWLIPQNQQIEISNL